VDLTSTEYSVKFSVKHNLVLKYYQKDGNLLCYGDKFSDAYEKFKDVKQLIAIGVNCTPPKFISSLLKSIRISENNPMPFIVYSNDGKIWDSKLFK
jgi:homocysteine S-methyltransferase